MNHPDQRIVVVGAGLAGLVAAWRLQQRGVADVTVLEARDRLGGRIASVDAAGRQLDPAVAALDRFDLGPTWYWPQLQPALERLVAELGLRSFDGGDDGDLLFERSPHEPPRRMPSYASEPGSARLQGATGAVVAALRARLTAARVLTGWTVHHLRHSGAALEVQAERASGETARWPADHVLLALPPRLAAQRVAFDPPLPPELARRWRATPTWMAPHAKFLAVYGKAFWRDKGLSGTAQSMVGPCTEIHDASASAGRAALFGFLGVPAAARQKLGEEALKGHCLDQLVRLFGPEAAHPVTTLYKDWAADPLTATVDDQGAAGHPVATGLPWFDPIWVVRAAMAGSETASGHPGYLEGALEAAANAVASLAKAGAAEEAM